MADRRRGSTLQMSGPVAQPGPNRLDTSLFKRTRELNELNESLEQQVQERTAQLQAKNQEVQAMSQHLWQAAKLATMGELAASIAHELNNPLATISLRVESILARIGPNDPSLRSLEIIQGETERMGGLVKRLLEFSRRSGPEISTVDVGSEVDNTLELVLHHLRTRNVSVQREFEEDVPSIHADRQQLRQVFLNLFTNASDAMAQGGTLTVRVISVPGKTSKPSGRRAGRPNPAPDRSAPARVVIEVEDTGGGIPADLLAKISEPFFTTKPEGKGTGLGLAICRRIVEEHHGSLEITSEPGRGTTVRVALLISSGQIPTASA